MSLPYVIGFMLVLVISYLLGSIPSAVWIVRLSGNTDIRKLGSGNPGATNVLRTMGWRPAVAVFLADALKGVLAMWVCFLISPFGYTCTAAAALAVIGHQYPLFAGFKGGRGVSTAAGVLVMLDWRVMIAGLIVFALVVLWSRIVSIASLAGAGASLAAGLLILLWLDGLSYLPVFLAVIFVVILLFSGHRDNIRRLREGRERPIEI